MEKNKNLAAYNPQSLCSQRVMKKIGSPQHAVIVRCYNHIENKTEALRQRADL